MNRLQGLGGELPPQQRRVLTFLHEELNRRGLMPTRAEISRELGLRSANSAEEHVRALESKGYLVVLPRTARGLQLSALARQLLAAPGLADDGRFLALPVVDMARLNCRAAWGAR